MAVTITVGSGAHTYEVAENWGELPQDWSFQHVAGIAISGDDELYIFNRSDHPIIVLDREGRFMRSWGEGRFKSAHGIDITRDGTLWLVDNKSHAVQNFSTAGAHLRTLGTPDQPAADGEPFNSPTDISIAPNGDLYISDGFGNDRVHIFTPDGEYVKSWGQAGVGAGDFNLPHNICVHPDGRVLVSDTDNHRVQIFDLDGKHLATWADFIQPTGIHVDRDGAVYVAELRNRITILDSAGRRLARWGRVPSHEPGQFIAPHAVFTDSHGDLYVGEVQEGSRIQKFIRV